MGIISLHHAGHVFPRGNTAVLTAGYRRKNGELGGDVFIITRSADPAEKFSLESTLLTVTINDEVLDTHPVKSPEGFISAEAIDWARNFLESEVSAAYREREIDRAPPPLDLVKVDVVSELLRLRLRGLPESIIARIARDTEDDELRHLLADLPRYNPMMVRTRPA